MNIPWYVHWYVHPKKRTTRAAPLIKIIQLSIYRSDRAVLCHYKFDQNINKIKLMLKRPNPSKYHTHFMFIDCGNYIFIFDTATWLDDCGNSCLS